MMAATHQALRRVRFAPLASRSLLMVLGVVALATLVGAGRLSGRPSALTPVLGLAPGGTWEGTTLSIQTNALVTEPSRLGALVAGTDDGVWRSVDGGRHWARVGSGLRGHAIDALAASAVDGVVFAGATDGAVYAHDARPDGPWRRLGPPLGASPIFSLAVSSGRRVVVLAGTIGALYRGVAEGNGWRWRRVARTGEAAISALAWSPSDTQRAVASVFGVAPPVLATDDGGWTWQAAATGLPSVLPTQALVALSPRHPGVILTTMGGGVWERSAHGPWRDISAGLPERHAMPLVALPGGGPTVLYAGTMGDGVYVKSGSAAWRRLGSGLRGVDNTILALGIGGGPHTALCAGTTHGVFRYVAVR